MKLLTFLVFWIASCVLIKSSAVFAIPACLAVYVLGCELARMSR